MLLARSREREQEMAEARVIRREIERRKVEAVKASSI